MSEFEAIRRGNFGPLTIPPGMPRGPYRNGMGENNFGPLTVPPGMPHGPYGLGQKTMTERDIIVSMRSTYIKTASDTSKVMEDTNKALSSYLTKYRKYKSEFGKTIRSNIMGKLGQYGISPFGMIGAISDSMKLATAIESESHALENTKKIYSAVSDTLKNVSASWAMFKNLKFEDLVVGGLVTDESVAALAKYIGQSFQHVKGTFLLNVVSSWASKQGISWSETFPSGGRVLSAENALTANLKALGVDLRIDANKKVGTKEWWAERNQLIVEYRLTFMGAAKKAYEEALKGKREPGVAEVIFNWIIDTAKSLLNLALFSIAGLPGLLLHFMGFRLIQFTDMTKAAYAAARILPAALNVIGQGSTTFSKTYKTVRIDQGGTDAEAKSAAVDAAEKKIEQVGKPAFGAALADIDRYMNHYENVQAAFDKFVEGLKALLWKLLIYAGVALGVVGVGWLILRQVMPTPTIRISR